MKITGFFRAAAPVTCLAATFLIAAMGGCAQEKPAPVGSVLDYDPAEDESIAGMEEYMNQDPTAGMEVEGGGRP